MSQEASEGKVTQVEEAVEEIEATGKEEEVEKASEEPIKEDSANNELQEQADAGETTEHQESHEETNEDENKSESSNENIEIRDPPVDESEVKEAVSEIPHEETQITEDIEDKVKSSEAAEPNAVENP